jgi:hypothetical protein
MTDGTKKNKTGYWLLFLGSLVFMALLLAFAPQWFWLSLPTALGGLAVGMDWI